MKLLRAALIAALAAAISTPSFAGDFSLEDWQTRVKSEGDINALAELYIEYLLEANPVYAVGFGIHGKDNAPGYYDERLPDVSAEGWASWYDTLVFLRTRLAEIDLASLSDADRTDLRILKTRIDLQILNVTRLGSMTT